MGSSQIPINKDSLMTTNSEQRRIIRLVFKDEGENIEGMAVGSLTDQDGRPVVPNEEWVTKKEALRIAHDLRVDLEDL